MGNTALNLLMREISDYQVSVEKLKIKIADCIIKAHSTPSHEVTVIFDTLYQMAKLIEEVKPKEIMLRKLFETKLKIENKLSDEDLGISEV